MWFLMCNVQCAYHHPPMVGPFFILFSIIFFSFLFPVSSSFLFPFFFHSFFHSFFHTFFYYPLWDGRNTGTIADSVVWAWMRRPR